MDTNADGWVAHFDRIRQTGRETGNDEEEEFVPNQCQIRDKAMFLVLTKTDHWVSGKIKSRRNLTQIAPQGGTLEAIVQGPNLQFHDGRRSRFMRGIWPALWLLPNDSWPAGGEIDLFEQMQFKYEDCNAGFSTLHFGPKGRDYIYPQHWGLSLGRYAWDERDHLLKFKWARDNGAWALSFWVDDHLVWNFSTRHEGILAVGREAGDGFAPGQPGNPAYIFQRAFDDPNHGLHIVANLSLGGRPFGHDTRANFKGADFAVKWIRVKCA